MIEALDAPKLHPTPPPSTHTQAWQPLPGSTVRKCKYCWLWADRITTLLHSSQLGRVNISPGEPSGEKPRKGNRSGKNRFSFCWNGALDRTAELRLGTWVDLQLHPSSETLLKLEQRNATVGDPMGGGNPKRLLPFLPYCGGAGGGRNFQTAEGNEFKTRGNSSSSLNTGIGSTHPPLKSFHHWIKSTAWGFQAPHLLVLPFNPANLTSHNSLKWTFWFTLKWPQLQ